MINKVLKQVIDDIYAEKAELSKKIEKEPDEFKKHDLEFQLDTVSNEKFVKIYTEMVKSISEEKDSELKDIIVDLLGSKQDYDYLAKKVSAPKQKPTAKEVALGVSGMNIVKSFDKLAENLSNLLTDESMKKVAGTVKKYVPASIDNTPIHPYDAVVADIKKGEKFNQLPKDTRSKVSKELDEINEVVKESPRRYSEAQTNFDTDYERIINAKNKKFYENYIENENKDFGKAFAYRDLNFLVKDDIADDPEKINITKSPSFTLTKATQDSILKVWKKMDELDIISAGNGGESGAKIYGFAKLHSARESLNHALRDENFSNLKELKDEYAKQLQNVREMYKIIKTELNPSPDKIPGNVQNFRENFVPAEFKNDISTNASFNGMYNTYSIVKSLGIAPEEFLSHPQKYIEQVFNKELSKFHIDQLYKGMSFEETLTRVYSAKTLPGLNTHGISRMVSTLNMFEKDAKQKSNNLVYSAVQSGKIETIFDDPMICYNYFSKEKTNTFINLLLTNKEDKNFENLRAYDSITSDKFHKTKTFDLASYLIEKQIPAQDIYDRVTKLLTTAYKVSNDSEKKYAKDQAAYEKHLADYKKGLIKTSPEMPVSKAMSKEEFANIVRDVQQGIVDYIMLSNSAKGENMDKLIGLLKNPAEALNSLNMEESYIEKLSKLKGKDVLLNQCKQRARLEGNLGIKNARDAENAYNKTAEKILKDANKLSKKVANESDAKKVEDLQKQSVLKMNELKKLQQDETQRLEREYKAGTIPGEYYKKRVENILSLNHNEKIAIFDDGLNKSAFIKSTGLEQLSKAEANNLFACEVERQKAEKEIFINRQFLQNNKLISTVSNNDAQVQKANFEQIDVAELDVVANESEREPLVVDEAKIEKTNEKSEPQKELDPKHTVKMP